MPTHESQWNGCSPRLAYEMTLEIAKQAPSNGLEPEMMTAIDDHPGFIVAATGLPLPPGSCCARSILAGGRPLGCTV